MQYNVPGGKFDKAAAVAKGYVLINAGTTALNGEDDSRESAITDFFVGFFSQLGTEKSRGSTK